MARPQIQVEFGSSGQHMGSPLYSNAPISPIRRAAGATSPLSGVSMKWESAFESAHERYGTRPVSFIIKITLQVHSKLRRRLTARLHLVLAHGMKASQVCKLSLPLKWVQPFFQRRQFIQEAHQHQWGLRLVMVSAHVLLRGL